MEKSKDEGERRSDVRFKASKEELWDTEDSDFGRTIPGTTPSLYYSIMRWFCPTRIYWSWSSCSHWYLPTVESDCLLKTLILLNFSVVSDNTDYSSCSSFFNFHEMLVTTKSVFQSWLLSNFQCCISYYPKSNSLSALLHLPLLQGSLSWLMALSPTQSPKLKPRICSSFLISIRHQTLYSGFPKNVWTVPSPL